VLFVHGGGEGAHEEDERLAASLRGALGAAYEVRSPKMPNEDSPEYAAWRGRISEELADMEDGTILVGHSLGASVVLRYVSEEGCEGVDGLFLVAAPFWGAEDWEVEEYALPEDFASKLPEGLPVFFYHGREDEIVPFEHLELYAQRFPRATFRAFDGRGHQFGEDLSEVARDMQASQEGDLPSGLAGPARRALLGAGYRRLGQLAGLRESQVGKLHGMGPKALGQLRRALHARGLSFADEEEKRDR